MNNHPLVSIIIPNYNHACYLDQRLQTILNQTYDNFEVIILDDNSTDNSLEVINRYKNDPHISIISVNRINSGSTYKQWNKGMHLAKGEIIWIAESDDYCELNMLDELVKAYSSHKGCVIAYCTLTIVNDKQEILEYGRKGSTQFIRGSQYVKRYLSLGNIIRNASCAIFSKSAALCIPDAYATFKGAGDYLFWVELALVGNVVIVNSPMCYYRRHIGTVTSSRDSDGTNFLEGKKVHDYIRKKVHISWLREQGLVSYHSNRLNNTTFDNEEIRRHTYEIMGVPSQFSFTQKVVKRIITKFRVKYNIYL